MAIVSNLSPSAIPDYSAPAGVIGLSRSVAVEWAPLNIRVNCVAPGAIETEGWKVYTPEARAAYPRSNPMMRAGSPWDIAEACVYLAGPSGRFVTGETLGDVIFDKPGSQICRLFAAIDDPLPS